MWHPTVEGYWGLPRPSPPLYILSIMAVSMSVVVHDVDLVGWTHPPFSHLTAVTTRTRSSIPRTRKYQTNGLSFEGEINKLAVNVAFGRYTADSQNKGFFCPGRSFSAFPIPR